MKATKPESTSFDADYCERVPEKQSVARRAADDWHLYVECFPAAKPIRNALLAGMESEILNAIQTGDAGFFRRFAKYLERPKYACKITSWLFELHLHNASGEQIQTFTHSELIEAAKRNGFYVGREDESILTDLKRKMKRLGFPWKNSPKKVSH